MTKFERINEICKELLPSIEAQALHGKLSYEVDIDRYPMELENFGFQIEFVSKYRCAICWDSCSPIQSLAHEMFLLRNSIVEIKRCIHESLRKNKYVFSTSSNICDPRIKKKLKEDGYPNFSQGTNPHEYLIDRE
jgi:hypothetical protein